MFTSLYIVLVINTLLVFSRICSGGWNGAYVKPQHPLDLILDLLGIHLYVKVSSENIENLDYLIMDYSLPGDVYLDCGVAGVLIRVWV